MSGDDIVFSDVMYREPRRLRRPDHDRRWTCIAYEVPGPADLPIFLDYPTADAIERHALRDTSVELGGILLGQECLDEQTGRPFVWVTQSLEAKHYENTQSSFTYTHDSWEEITRERDRRFPQLDIVGWYHTHPDFGIFLSSHDQFIHQNFFAQPLQVAYVVDPIRQTRGFFQWRDGRLDRVGGFFLAAERGDRLALARFINDLENIPNTGGGAGALSPRLEAELIAMLSRPTYAPASASPSQTAALFSLFGMLLGVLGLAAALWLVHLGRQVQDQGETLEKLLAAVKPDPEAAHRAELEEARLHAKEAALNTLLLEVRAGGSKEGFAKLYTQAIQERDEARRDLTRQRVDHVAVADRSRRLEAERDAAQAQVAKLAPEAKRAKELEEQLAARREKDGESKEPSGDRLLLKYDYAWYAAVAGWIVSLLLALGLIAVYARSLPAEEPVEHEPPHTIT